MDANLPLVIVVLSQCLEVDVELAACVGSLALAGRVAEPTRRWLWRLRTAQKVAQNWRFYTRREIMFGNCWQLGCWWLVNHGYADTIWQDILAIGPLEIMARNAAKKPWRALTGRFLGKHAVIIVYRRIIRAFKLGCMLAKGAGETSSLDVVSLFLLRLDSLGLSRLADPVERLMSDLDALNEDDIYHIFDIEESDDDAYPELQIQFADWNNVSDKIWASGTSDSEAERLAEEGWICVLLALEHVSPVIALVVMLASNFNMGDFVTADLYGHWEFAPFSATGGELRAWIVNEAPHVIHPDHY